ncbi:hypothetical protein LAV73_08000 [Lysinibacillus xylanilyticus]|uniref:hypothetical protein n=1 Tax=Lysinibacillus xylanilyticus TaxID=582475 RepID=UPI002B2522A7|nr:hypothetical protein [Lysinibacillus xylanilyticus]MEB2279945.1 hypothetical protein [Lysinibacillus xylanilyticus]
MTNIVARDPAGAADVFCAKAKRQQHQKRLIERPQEALLCAKAKRSNKCFL